MPVMVLGKVQEVYQQLLVNFTSVIAGYPHLTNYGLEITCFVIKIYSPEGRVTEEPRSLETFKIESKYNGNTRKTESLIDMTRFLSSNGTPVDYTIEFIALVFNVKSYEKEEKAPIYPGELREVVNPGVVYEAQRVLKNDETAFFELSGDYGVTLLLTRPEYRSIGSNLLDGLSRLNNSDFGGSVMSFRKTVEAWRDLLRTIDKDKFHERRIEQLEKFAAGAIGALSNFGLHAPANAGPIEARFSRRIATALTEYTFQYLGKREV